MARTILLAIAAAVGAAACGGPVDPLSGVIHLDLRLDDGGSPAAALAAAMPAVERRFGGAGPRELLPWRVENAQRLEPGQSGKSARFRDRSQRALTLRYQGVLNAEDVSTIELVSRAVVSSQAVLRWNGADGPGEVKLATHAQDRSRTYAFAVGKDPRWQGEIRDLVLIPSGAPNSVAEIESVRLLPAGFRWGEDAPIDVEAAGHAGLRRCGDEAQRAWPSDLGVPLFASPGVVPRGAWLEVHLGRGEGLALSAPLHVAIDGHDGATWRRLYSGMLSFPKDGGADGWQRVVFELEEVAGASAKLRFTVTREPFEANALSEPAEPITESVLWGAPMIVGEPPAGRRPNVVLITLDTLRADAVGSTFTPFLNEVASEGILFENAWASSNATTPSHASILTGLQVEEHGVISNRHLLGSEVTTLAESLRAAGYHTAAAVSVPHLDPEAGFGQGFDRFAFSLRGGSVDGALATDRARTWVRQWADLPDRPVFLWLHLFDPHAPYTSPKAFVREFLAETGLKQPPASVQPATMPTLPEGTTVQDLPAGERWMVGVSSLEHARFLYDLGVARADSLCAELMGEFDRWGVDADTALFIVSDHGEGFGEHGSWFIHTGLYRESVHVPLIMRLPESVGEPAGVRSSARVSNLDVAPTILRMLGARSADALAGADLLAVARDGGEAERAVWFAHSSLHQLGYRNADEHFIGTFNEGLPTGQQLVVREGRAEVVELPTVERGRNFLFEAEGDPWMKRDLATEEPERAEAALERLRGWREQLRRARVERRTLSREEEAGLQDLGYAGD